MTLIKTIAVIGLGSVGLRHAGNLTQMGIHVIGYDPDPAHRAALGELGGVMAESRDDALRSAGAAVIASPNAAHLEDAHSAIMAGCHVLIEKPLAHKIDGVDDMLNLAAERGLVVAVGHNQRFQPVVEAALEIIRGGQLGDLTAARFVCSSYLPDWRPGQDHRKNYTADATSGGVLFDISHEFDLAYHLLGGARTASATAQNSGTLGIAAEDSADVVLQHGCGARTDLHLDYKSKQASRHFEIVGSGGQINVDLRQAQLIHKDVTGDILDKRTFAGGGPETYEHEMKDFINAIQNSVPPRCDGAQGLDVLRLVLAARRLSGLPAAA